MSTEQRKHAYGDFGFFTSVEEAVPVEDTEFCLAEMPIGGYFINKDKVYQVVKYENNNFQMIVKTLQGDQIEMDPENNYLYLGRSYN